MRCFRLCNTMNLLRILGLVCATLFLVRFLYRVIVCAVALASPKEFDEDYGADGALLFYTTVVQLNLALFWIILTIPMMYGMIKLRVICISIFLYVMTITNMITLTACLIIIYSIDILPRIYGIQLMSTYVNLLFVLLLYMMYYKFKQFEEKRKQELAETAPIA